jgi:hypothetical protein
LTRLTSSKLKFEWHSSYQQAFDEIKKVIGTEIQVLLCCPDFNKLLLFHIYSDPSDHQWAQSSCRIKCQSYSQKLNTVQKRYTITETRQGLLLAIEILKEHKNIMLGYNQLIIVFTDHNNNIFNGLKA